jgi:hypothetical protein
MCDVDTLFAALCWAACGWLASDFQLASPGWLCLAGCSGGIVIFVPLGGASCCPCAVDGCQGAR